MNLLLRTIALTAILVMGAGAARAQSAAGSQSISTSQAAVSSITIANQREDLAKKKIVIERVLERHGSPLAETADGFVKACAEYNLNCYLLPAISGVESTFGRFLMPGSYNPFGWGGGYISFNSWEEGYMTVAKGLRRNYINRGAVTVEQVGSIYAASDAWPQKVRHFLAVFEAEEHAYEEELRQSNVKGRGNALYLGQTAL